MTTPTVTETPCTPMGCTPTVSAETLTLAAAALSLLAVQEATTRTDALAASDAAELDSAARDIRAAVEAVRCAHGWTGPLNSRPCRCFERSRGVHLLTISRAAA